MKKIPVLLKGLCAFAVLFGMTGNVFAQDFGVRREVWTGLTGSSLLNLTNGPTLQSPANLVEILTNAFEGPYNYDDKFGDRFRALLIPPISGTYVFWVQGDDAGILSLSTDESPWNKRQIAVNTLTALYRAWYVYPSQESTNIFLQAGQRYFIEALHSAGTGDDSFAVGWKLPDGTLEQPIPASRLKPYGAPAVGVPGFSIQPTNVTVTENSSVTFLVGTTNLDAVTYQWQRNGINLQFGFGASLVIPSVTSGDSGATFRCIVSNTSGSVTSFQATLTVTLDLARPTLSGVANIDSGTVEVLFSESVEAASGTNVANYGLSGGAIVNFAKFATGSTRAVQLSAGPLAFGSNYTLTVNNVKDRAATPNTILANTQLTFPVLLKGIYREVYTNVPGSAISDLTNNPAFPNSPNFAEMLTGPFETASYQFNHYGQRVRARILPPVTGNYTFWVAAGNSALLFLGTNNNPSSIRQIASVNELMSVSTHQWEVQTNQRSAPITLTGGQQYYIEAWTKGGISEGFPADHLALRWQMPDGTIEEAIPALRFTPEGMGSVNLVQFPTDVSVMEGTSATFTVSASNLERVTYQWQQNGINIPGATNATYIDAVVKLAENNATLRCLVSNGFATTNSPAALLTVTPDVTPPGLANVFNQGSNRVVIFYSKPVEAFSATNVLNYSIGGIIISNAVLQSDNRSVFLATSKLSSGSNYLVTVNGVRDRATTPNSIVPNSQWVLQVSDFYPQDIGGPSLPGSFVQNGNGVDITASGSGLSAAGDQMTFGYQQRRGDFDVKVRLQRLDFADTWTFAGLVAREDLTTNCQFAGVFSTPSINGTFFEYRTNGGAPQITGSFPANYPYTWLRLQRLNGQTYNGFASYDGLTWIKLGSVTETNPATMYVGLAVSSRNPARSTIAEFRDFAEAGDNDVVGNFSPQVEPLGPSSRRTGLVFTEIMYHPAPRTDARRQEFIELYNSNPTIEDISGFRISGDVDYTFAPGTIIPGGGFLVIAKNPADIQTIYGIPSVLGPYAKSLSNKKGTVRLRNRQDAILLEVNYDSKAPWPPGPDGTGHSLVLARPSSGESHPEAWAQSDRFGGSPGKVDGYGWEPARNVMINELLAHTDFPEVDYIELYNHSKVLVDLSGCWLTDDPATNKFWIPNGTTIAPGGFLYFTETTMGFGLSAAGEAIYLVNSNLTRILDCLSFEAQENGVPYGRFPDGAPRFSRLAAKTPGGTNAPIRSKSLVINEIMYHPITDDDNDEFIELYNRGPGSVNLSGWRLTDGIDFTFPTNTIVASNGYLVVAKNIGRLLTNYANLNTNNTVGNYSGTLANSGERIALSMPDSITSTNLAGVITTNWIYIPVDEVLYGTGGKWGKWSDAGGSSLELIDPRSDNRLPSNWADSDDSAKSTWTSLSISGAFDNAGGSAGEWNEVQFFMLNAGECLVDQVNVSITQPFVSGNIVTNSGFEAGMSFWTAIGDQRNSFIENTGFAGTKSLHVVSTGRGDVGANRIHTVLTQQYTTNGMSGTISAQAKWLRGTPYMVFRLRGNHLEIPAVLNVPKNLGTPGARNSRFSANVGPAITEIQHTPVLPAANQPIVVSARIHDPDGVASVQVVWRVDSIGSPVNTVTMSDNGTGGDAVAGDGIYTGTIPGQANDKMLAFYVQATDGASPGLTTRFPNDAPTRECLVHIGEEQPISTFGTYRFWMTQATLNDWLQHEKFSSEDYKGTFVLGNYRVIYNAASHYAGSPAHAKLFDSPIGTNCDYQLALPADDALLDETSLRIQEPGLFGTDSTCQNEQFGYWLINQMGLPSLNRRSINIYINGFHRGLIYEDTQRQNSGFDQEWYPNANPDLSDLYRIGYWYEFSDDMTHRSDMLPTLEPITTTGGVKKLAVYRQTFNKRAIKDSPHNYTNLFNLVNLLNTAATGDEYAARVYPELDIKSWARAFAAERILNNTDLYGAKRINGPDVKPGAQNSFIFRPGGDTWKFLIWDIDAAFLGLPTDPLFDFTDSPVSNLFTQPLVLRTYWQALEDAAYGPLQPSVMYPVMDSKFDAYRSSGVAAAAPQKMKDFLNVRRDYIIELLNGVRSGFSLTNNGGLNLTNDSTVFTLGGSAPISARKITINGVNYPLSWNTITNWYVRLALSGQTNVFVVQGWDANGNAVPGATRTITIYYNGPVSRAEDSLVINEILYNPAISNASYVEIFNRSTNTIFDLWNYRLDGLNFSFKAGTFIPPQGFLMVVENIPAFEGAYGTNPVIAGEFNGTFDKNGESLKLVRQAPTTNETDVIIDRVKYEAVAPWALRPAITNSGAALQLIDAAQDNARVSNWDDGVGWQFFSYYGKPNSSSAKLFLYLNAPGEVYLDDIRVVLGTNAAVGSNYIRNGDFESPVTTSWTLAGSGVSTSVSTNIFAKTGTNSLRLIFTASGSTSVCLQQDLSSFSFSTASNYTVSFWYHPSLSAGSGTNLTVKLGSTSSSAPTTNVVITPMRATPGLPNSVAGTVTPYPLLWINEVQPNNPSGFQDNTGTPQPWVELFNSGTNTISLDGLFLARSYTNLTEWAFPTGAVVLPKQFRIVFADGQPQLSTGTVLHTSFRLAPTNGSLVLSRGQQILDYVNYTNMQPSLSYGSYPDGQLFDRQLFYFITPGASNNPAPVPVAINEWMASNTNTLINPLKNKFDDWVELYNFGNSDINLGGFYLTDDLNNKKKFRIPNGFTIAGHGFAFCWADNDITLTNVSGNAAHANFAISKGGGQLGLFDPTGIQVDSVVFGAQTSDVSQGRFPDGNVGGVLYFMSQATPRTNNVVTNNLYAPVLSAIADVAVNEGSLLTVTAHATDNDFPAQQLSFSLLAGTPEGMALNPVTGVLTWTPSESQGGAVYPVSIRVSDNGGPPQTDTKSFNVTVNDLNSPPVIGAIANQTASPNTNLSFSIPAADSDIPAQVITYQLVAGPGGSSLNASSGLFSWTPSVGQALSTNLVVVRVTDNGAPALSATQTFAIVVRAANICGGFLGDVVDADPLHPANSVDVLDWVQVGRFSASLEYPTNSCQMIKAKCSANTTADTNVTVVDWVQAGRFAALLDPWVAVSSGAGFAPTKALSSEKSLTAKSAELSARTLRIDSSVIERGKTNCIQVLLNAQGDENALSFSVDFDTNVIRYVSNKRGSGSFSSEDSPATILPNTNGVGSGRVAFSLILPTDEVFNAGTQQLVTICFRALPGTELEVSPVALVDEPVKVLVSDTTAHQLPVTAIDGQVIVMSVNFATLESINIIEGGQVRLKFLGATGIWELQASSDLEHWVKVGDLNNTTGELEYIDSNPPPDGQRFYRAVKPLP